MNTRLISSRVIDAVIGGASLAEALPQALEKIEDARDRALVQAICYGVCRYYERLDIVLSFLLKSPMQGKDSDVYALILVGLYQLMDMRIPEHAAVSETVNATKKIKKDWARGFVNAILREYLRNKEDIEKRVNEDEEALYAHPKWLMQEVKKAWPDQWQEILMANNEHPPFSLRVNNPEQFAGWVERRSDTPTIEKIKETKSGYTLSIALPVEDLPGFAQGKISVQDGAAQLAAELMMLEKGQRVLDACSAPGGKLMHMLECEPELDIVAVEKDKARIKSIEENLVRLGSNVTIDIKRADAAALSSWWDDQPFDRILLDAPCSASGVIRRHPDIKMLRQPGDIRNLAADQLKILTELWKTLKPGGLLLYVTCSIFPEENAGVVKKFLQTHQDAQEDKIDADWGVACEVGRQILPGMHNMDGFYYARLVKR